MRASAANSASKRGSLRTMVPSVGPPAPPPPGWPEDRQQFSVQAQAVRVSSAKARSRRLFMASSPSIGSHYTGTRLAAQQKGRSVLLALDVFEGLAQSLPGLVVVD